MKLWNKNIKRALLFFTPPIITIGTIQLDRKYYNSEPMWLRTYFPLIEMIVGLIIIIVWFAIRMNDKNFKNEHNNNNKNDIPSNEL